MTAKRKMKMNMLYLPAIALMLFFIAYPLGRAIMLSLFNWNGYSSDMAFIGGGNYVKMFADKNFISSMGNTLLYGFGSTAIQQVIGLALALFVNSKFRGRNVVRAVIYMPAMIAGLIMGYIMYFFFQYRNGVMNDLLNIFGVEKIDWLGTASWAILIIILVNSWQFVGVSMILYLAGLQGISNDYIEASTVDGANAKQRFRYVILPLLIPAIASSVTYNLIGGLKLYDIIVSLTDGGPAARSHSLATYIANRYFDGEQAGYAAAIGIFSFVMILIISTIVNNYFRKKEDEIC